MFSKTIFTSMSFQVVKCAVCRSLVNEVQSSIASVDPRKKVDVGSYRIDENGKQKLSQIKYAGSEVVLCLF